MGWRAGPGCISAETKTKTFVVQGETVGWSKLHGTKRIDANFSNDEVEWKSNYRKTTVLTGVLIRYHDSDDEISVEEEIDDEDADDDDDDVDRYGDDCGEDVDSDEESDQLSPLKIKVEFTSTGGLSMVIHCCCSINSAL